MLTILMGRAKTGKSEQVLRQIRELGDSGQQILLVPEHASHQAEVDLCRFCGDTASRHAEVLSFRRLCDRVLTLTGGAATALSIAAALLLTRGLWNSARICQLLLHRFRRILITDIKVHRPVDPRQPAVIGPLPTPDRASHGRPVAFRRTVGPCLWSRAGISGDPQRTGKGAEVKPAFLINVQAGINPKTIPCSLDLRLRCPDQFGQLRTAQWLQPLPILYIPPDHCPGQAVRTQQRCHLPCFLFRLCFRDGIGVPIHCCRDFMPPAAFQIGPKPMVRLAGPAHAAQDRKLHSGSRSLSPVNHTLIVTYVNSFPHAFPLLLYNMKERRKRTPFRTNSVFYPKI